MAATETSISPDTPAPTATPATPASNLADQYEVGDIGAPASEPTSGGSHDQPSAEPSSGFPAPPATASLSPRDPATGRFVKPQHPKYLAQMAEDMGLTADQIADSDPEVLAQTVYHLRQREASIQQTMHDALDRQTPTTPRADEPKPSGPAADAGFELPPEISQYDPFVQQMARTLKQVVAENKAFREQLGQVSQHVQGQVRQTLTQRCDTAFSKHKDFLGDGRREDFPPGDPMLARRQAVLSLVQTLKGGSLEANIDKAVETLYGSAPAKGKAGLKPAPGHPSEDDWRQGVLSRPTQRSGAAEPPGEEKARQTVKRYLEEHAADAGAEPGISPDEFPG